MVYHNLWAFFLLHYLFVTFLLLPLLRPVALLLLLLIRRLNCPPYKDLGRFVHGILVHSRVLILIILGMLAVVRAVVIFLFGLDLLDASHPQLHVIQERYGFEFYFFAEGGQQLGEEGRVFFVQSQVQVLLFKTVAECISFLTHQTSTSCCFNTFSISEKTSSFLVDILTVG